MLVIPKYYGTPGKLGENLRMNDDMLHAEAGATLPPWHECDWFCIHHYAGTGAPPCGWRGRIEEARCEIAGARPLCPRCGQATLFRIQAGRSQPANP